MQELSKKPVIAVTMGDAAGVGPELCLCLLQRGGFDQAIPLIIGDIGLLERVASRINVNLSITEIKDPLSGASGLAGIEPGRNQAACGAAAARYIEAAASACLAGQYAAMVTAPISKKALNMAGVNYPGHTEMLADLTHTQNYAMLLYSDQVACAFVTCHQSLASVPKALSVERIVEVAELAHRHMRILRGVPPRLCLLGLNPHAGEEGLFGDEEIRILRPAKDALLKRGIQIEGPLPPDTAFTPSALKRFDCHIAMYHDQGGIPFKMLAFDTGVNITMGLPIIRTSPDHGTAFDIAWKGTVNPASFFSAYDLAVRLALSKKAEQ